MSLWTGASALGPVEPWIRSQRLPCACVRRAVGVETLQHPPLRWGFGLALGPVHRDGLSARSTGTLGFHRFGGQAWRLRRAVGDGESCLRGLFVVVGFGSATPLVGLAVASAIFGAALTTVMVSVGSRYSVVLYAGDSSAVLHGPRRFGGSRDGFGLSGVLGGLGRRQLSIRVGGVPACGQPRLVMQWSVVRGERPLLWRVPGQIMRSDRAAG